MLHFVWDFPRPQLSGSEQTFAIRATKCGSWQLMHLPIPTPHPHRSPGKWLSKGPGGCLLHKLVSATQLSKPRRGMVPPSMGRPSMPQLHHVWCLWLKGHKPGGSRIHQHPGRVTWGKKQAPDKKPLTSATPRRERKEPRRLGAEAYFRVSTKEERVD